VGGDFMKANLDLSPNQLVLLTKKWKENKHKWTIRFNSTIFRYRTIYGDYQLKLLSGNLLQTYLRKRMITVSSNNGVLSPYEFKILDDDNKRNI
jgi:hypothetical protein